MPGGRCYSVVDHGTVPGVPMVPWYHGTMVPWYTSLPTPGTHITRYPGCQPRVPPRHSLCQTEAFSRKTTLFGHFSVTFPAFLARPPNKTESVFRLFREIWDPAPNKPESERSGFRKPDLGIHAQDPSKGDFLATFDGMVG